MILYSEMTPEQQAETRARLDAHQASKPPAIEPDAPSPFEPGVVFFEDGQYCAVSPDVAMVWPWIDYIIEMLLRFAPSRHRLEYWRERIERGATLALAFVDSKDMLIRDAGILNCETSDDGKPIVLVAVCTFDQLNLEHASKIAEIAALALGAEQVHLWTPKAVPVVPGYHVESCWFGQLQVADVRPIQ
jgi:hypothetical protein